MLIEQERLLDDMLKHFEAKSDYITEFARQCSAKEWWFQCEIMLFFRRKKIGYVTEIEYPQKIQARRYWCDFKFDFPQGIENWLELKTVLTRKRAGISNYDVESSQTKAYFRGVTEDIRKLHLLRKTTNASLWSLFFLYPSSDESKQQVEKMINGQGDRILSKVTRAIQLSSTHESCLISLIGVK